MLTSFSRISSIITVASLLVVANGFQASSNSKKSFVRQHDVSFSSSSLSMSASALIVQNKGGGHGELGFQLAKNLVGSSSSDVTSITILQDDAANDAKEPFKSYGELPSDIVKVVKAPLSSGMTKEELKEILGDDATFDYVWDNCSKKPEGAGKALCDLAKEEWGTKLFTYVSSAGMYQPKADTAFPMDEDTTPIKESAGQNLFDKYAAELGLPYVSFRPQYIYGPKANKYDYIDWYFDRLVRDLPLPIPGDGSQKVSLTNSEDVASILASVLNDPEKAVEQRFFNCGTDQLVSYNELAYMCAEAAGIKSEDVKIEYYDADVFGKATFPFRLIDFYVAPDKVKGKLGWERKCDLKEDLQWYFEGYKSRGGPEKQMSLIKDWEITVGSKSSFDNGSAYDKYDPLVLDTSNCKDVVQES